MNRRIAALLLISPSFAVLACRAERSTAIDEAARVDCLEACRSTLSQAERAIDRIRFDAATEPSARFSGALSGTAVPRAVVLAPPTSGAALRLQPDPTHNPLPNPEHHGIELRLDAPLDAETVSGLFLRARASYELTNAWIGFGQLGRGAAGPDMSVVEFRFSDDAGTRVAEVELAGHPKWTGEIAFIGFGFQSHEQKPIEILEFGVVRSVGSRRAERANEGEPVQRAQTDGESRPVVRAPAPSSCTCNETIPAGAILDVAFGVSEAPREAETRGVTFCVSVEAQPEPRSVVWSRYVSPARTASGQQWQSARIPLGRFGGKSASIHFETFDGSRCEAIGAPGEQQAAWVSLDLVGSRHVAPRKPSVVLISLDTLRADRLDCYGAERQTSPAIDAMAAEGVLFEQAIAQAPLTHASHMSLFTGLYPTEHRVQRRSDVLSAELPYLVESFRNAGYRTAAITEGGFVAAHYGFDRGFQSYREADPDASRRELVGRTFGHATRWLERFAGEQFFLFVHTYEVHPPMHPPDDLIAQFAGDYRGPITAPFPAQMDPSLTQLLQNSRFPPEDIGFIRDLYDAGVRNADDHVASLLATLRRLEILDSTLVVVLSDHGEELADHFAIPQHGHTLYDELLRVPLVMRGPGLPAGTRIRDQVQLIDVLPTLLDLVDLPFERESISGRSVVGALRGERMEPRRAFAANVEPADKLGVRARVDGKTYKLILTSDFETSPWIRQIGQLSDLSRLEGIPAQVELFDLDEDPAERVNVAESRPSVTERLRRVLAGYAEKHSVQRKASAPPAIPPDVAERLRSLGYIAAE